jgi:hypothetical protein
MTRKRAATVLVVVASIFGVIALLATAGTAMDSPTDGGGWAGVGVFWLLCGLFAFLAVKRYRLRS